MILSELRRERRSSMTGELDGGVTAHVLPGGVCVGEATVGDATIDGFGASDAELTPGSQDSIGAVEPLLTAATSNAVSRALEAGDLTSAEGKLDGSDSARPGPLENVVAFPFVRICEAGGA